MILIGCKRFPKSLMPEIADASYMTTPTTPMLRQYQELKQQHPGTLLFFRLGDFYELFFEDAKEASVLLNVALTKRNSVPMCGVPYHAAQNYIAKLIKAGRRVAICDQTSEPQPGKIVSRDITQIISAGTISELNLLESKRLLPVMAGLRPLVDGQCVVLQAFASTNPKIRRLRD